MSKLPQLRTSHLLLVSLSGPSAQLTRICYLCPAATAVSDKEVFLTVPLKSGMKYHFWSLRQSSSLNSVKCNLKTHKILPITDHLATAFSASDSTFST